MTWLENHRRSERYASEAQVAKLRGDDRRAKELYAIAAGHEEQALNQVSPDKSRTYGITALSAVALHFKAAEFSKAKALSYRCLAFEGLPKFAYTQIEDILQSINTRQDAEAGYEGESAGTVNASLTFSGKPVVGSHGIEAGFVGKALAAFETAVASTGASLNGSLREKGPIPNRTAYGLLVTGTAHGSFGFKFEADPRRTENIVRYPQVGLAVEKVKDILRASIESSDEDELSEQVSDIDQRALKHLSEFLDILAKNETVFALEFRDDMVRFNDDHQVKRSAERLGRIENSENIELDGVFRGVLPNSRRVEFLVESTREIITGRASEEVAQFAEINTSLSSRVLVRRRQIRTAKPSYIFLRILPRTHSASASRQTLRQVRIM